MAKSRAAGTKKTANKKAAPKAAKKPSKVEAKKAAKRPAAAAKKAVKKAAPAKAKAAKAPAKKSAPARKAAPAAKKEAPKKEAAKKKSAPTKAPSKTATVEKPSRAAKATEAKTTVELADLAPFRPPRAEAGEPRRPAAEGTITAHPEAQLTQDQVELLYEKLVAERERVVAGFDRHLTEALSEAAVMPDETDMAQRSTEQAYLIRFADKERKLLSEIEHAIEKLRSGEYGVCEGTEEAIGFKRLELRPWTRYSVGYKEQMERERSQHRR